MSRHSARWVVTALIACEAAPVQAQDEHSVTAAELTASQREELRAVLERPQECDIDEMQPDRIIVCRELAEDDTEQVMSPLPRPIEVRQNQLDGLREPPCWVTGKQPCFRIGSAPPPVYLVDFDALPDTLSDAEAALVFDADVLPPQTEVADAAAATAVTEAETGNGTEAASGD